MEQDEETEREERGREGTIERRAAMEGEVTEREERREVVHGV